MQPATDIAADTIIARTNAVVGSEVDGQLLIMNIEQGRYFALDAVAADVWSRLEVPGAFAALVDALHADYAAPKEEIAADLRALLATMLTNGMIVLRPA
jgi:hypothetical protein